MIEKVCKNLEKENNEIQKTNDAFKILGSAKNLK